MKKQLLLSALCLYGATLVATAVPKKRPSFMTDPNRRLTVSILQKQQSKPAPALKSTAANKRLIANSYKMANNLSDSNHYYYSNGRGSTLTDPNSYFDNYYPTSVTDTQFLKCDSSVNWHRIGSSLQETNRKRYTYNSNNQPITVSNTSYGLVSYDINRNTNGNRNYIEQSDTIGSSTIISKFKTYYLYNSQNKLASDSTVSTIINMPMAKRVYNYDANGNMLSFDSYSMLGSSWMQTYRITYDYDASNRVVATTSYSDAGSGLEPYALDSFGYVGTSNNYDWNASYFWNSTSSSWYGDNRFTYHYNSQSLVDTYYIMTWNAGNWDTVERDRYTYDNNNLMQNSFGYAYLGGGVFSSTNYDMTTMYYEDIPSGITNTSKAKDIVVMYPNPASHILTLDANGIKANVRVINTMGQELIRQEHILLSKYQLNIGQLPAGNYTIMLQDEHGNMLSQKQFTKL